MPESVNSNTNPSVWEQVKKTASDQYPKISKPFSDFAASCSHNAIANLCRTAYRHPGEFLLITAGAGVIGAVGLAVTGAAFNAWIPLLLIGSTMCWIGVVFPPAMVAAVLIMGGPLTTASLTLGLIVGNYANFIRDHKDEIKATS